MHLSEYRISINFVKHIAGDHITKHYSAAIESDLIYLGADIDISPEMYDYFKQGDYRAIMEDLCHELVHILTDEYYKFIEKLMDSRARRKYKRELHEMNERQTQRIAAAIMTNIKTIEP